ncbi:MAG: 2-oxo acid dehydrogenase subunit E2 [Candidatus Eremiobacteraeota bacterium]|nr:2-oxo acid dehydrogenase subunit E2 [Candidatus Eremiobacteraeota bacterium]
MAVELEMPELAESVIEGEIVKWLVKEGEHVKQDQPLVEVMTDKVTVEIPSPYEGVLLKQIAPEGAIVPVGKPIAIFGKEGESVDQHAASTSPSEAATPSAQTQAPAGGATAEKPVIPPEKLEPTKPAATNAAAASSASTQPAAQPRGNGQPHGIASQGENAVLSRFGRPLAAPAVRKLAREMGVDLFHVRGSGDGGRIRREDVQRVAAQAPSGLAQPPRRATAVAVARDDERVPLRGLRRVIADHMVHSKHTAAHTLHVDEADLTELVSMRERAKEKAAAAGVKLTYLPFFVKAVTGALKQHPYMNASLDDERHEIILKQRYNIGIAVNTDDGLVVPVIHDADAKTIFELAADIGQLADKARHGKLAHDEITDGTFTITNVGSVGGLFTFPVINYPEVGILGTHSIQQRPVVRDGQIAIRHMMYLSISFDHRVVDGAVAALFVKDVAQSLEHPDVMLMEGG